MLSARSSGRRRPLAVLVLVAVPLLLAAAGSCSSSQDLGDWLDKADAICRAAQANADNNPAPESPLPGDALRLTASRSRVEIDELKELTKPSDRASAVEQYLITLGRRADQLEIYAEALDKAPAQGEPPSRAGLEDVTSQAYTEAIALGLEDCAGGVDFTIDTTTTTLPVEVGGPTTTPGPTGVVGQPEGEEVIQEPTG